MTIKQQGGVFGRNPTFNNVEVDGTATLDNIASSDKLRVTASDNPAAYIEFENTFQNTGIATQAGLLLGVNSSVQTNYAGVIATENSANSNAVFLDLYANNGSGPFLVARARNNKNFEIVDGDLVVASGHGIDFSATSGTGTSELFDDYEEGTFTPAFTAASGAFDTLTYSLQHGNYTKIGNTVRVQIGIATSEVVVGTASGNLTITGLPFAQSSTFNTAEGGSIGYMLRFATSMPEIKTYIIHNSSEIKFDKSSATATTGSQLQVADLKTGASPFNNYMAISFVYKTA